MAGSTLKIITDQTFAADVQSSKLPVLIDFWAEWCGPCKMLTPIVEEIAKEFDGKIVIGKVDIDSNPQLAAKYNINSIPTLLFFKGGNVVDQHTGLLAKAPLKSKIEKIFQIK